MPIEKLVEENKQKEFAAREMAPDKLKASEAVNTFYIRMPGKDPAKMLTYRVTGKIGKDKLEDLLKAGKPNELSASLKFEIADVSAGKYRKLGDSTVLAHAAEKDIQISSKPPAFKAVLSKAKAPEKKPEQTTSDPIQSVIQNLTKFVDDLRKILDSSHAKPTAKGPEIAEVNIKPSKGGIKAEYGEEVIIKPVYQGPEIAEVNIKPSKGGIKAEYGEEVIIKPQKRDKL
ncbi:hypothetical protein HYT84_00870 [Candidatus Micrarchaeota archaeon]|nr:hypothetical protein [Candidatus Micrarchaeota archaeon]